jgi:hypothetical protein
VSHQVFPFSVGDIFFWPFLTIANIAHSEIMKSGAHEREIFVTRAFERSPHIPRNFSRPFHPLKCLLKDK